jgi:PAS domain S-box-containing protein
MEFFTKLFDSSDFPPRWSCGSWTDGHGWLHILSDLGIFSAYFAIPVVLACFVARRRDLPFRRVFILFGAFILLCGATHLMEAVIFWWPAYRIAGLLKLITALVSWATVITLIPLVPRILAMRSPEELEREIDLRKSAEAELQTTNAELEQRVADRTRELTAAVAALEDERELLSTTLASIGDGVIVTDGSGRVTFLNPVAEALTGWTTADARDEPLDRVFYILNEHTREPVENPADRALAEGIVVGLANHTVLIARDGTEKLIDDSAAPIRYQEGMIVGCVLVFRDVSARRAAESRLVESEERLRFVMDAMPQKIFTAKPDGALSYFNPHWSDFTGQAFEMDGKRGWSQFIHPDDLVATVRIWHHSIATGEAFEIEHRFRRGDGDYCWHITRAKAQKDPFAKVKIWVGSATDIHDQIETANQLRGVAAKLSEADRRKDEFLATLAHELRNPLAPMRTGLHLMRRVDGEAKAAEARAMMERQLEHLIRLVDDLMDVSRISRGRIELRRNRVDIDEVIRNAVEACCPAGESCDHELIIRLPDSPVTVHADLTRLAQVFTNLLNNAIKYSDAGSAIHLTARVDQGKVIVIVKDEGIGIDRDHLPGIFDMFAQLDRSIEKSRGGLGIGLSLVKRLVEMHDGTVEANSDGAGRGAEFIVTLPVIPDPDTTSITPGEGAEPEAAASSLRILVVDDNHDSADTLSMLLDALGHETCTAYEGQAALSAADSFSPEVVLLDIGLPGISGYEICRLLRQRPGGEALVIFAQTGWGQEEDRRRTQEAGFDYHLVKPVDPADLISRLLEVDRKKRRSP